jgi:hypothetical protein
MLEESGRCCLDIYLAICNLQASGQMAISAQGKFGRGHPAIAWMEQKGFILTTEDDWVNLLVVAKGYTFNEQEGQKNHEFCAFPNEHT